MAEWPKSWPLGEVWVPDNAASRRQHEAAAVCVRAVQAHTTWSGLVEPVVKPGSLPLGWGQALGWVEALGNSSQGRLVAWLAAGWEPAGLHSAVAPARLHSA